MNEMISLRTRSTVTRLAVKCVCANINQLLQSCKLPTVTKVQMVATIARSIARNLARAIALPCPYGLPLPGDVVQSAPRRFDRPPALRLPSNANATSPLPPGLRSGRRPWLLIN